MLKILLFAALVPLTAFGQTAPVSADHASPTAIVAALYSVISGPAGQARDWDRFKGLFAPTAKLFAVAKRPDGSFAHVPMSPDDYITRSGKSLVENGFVEREMNYKQQQFDNIVHRWSAYEGRVTAKPETAPIRGINSIQLISDGKRWFILSVLWEAESGELKLPKKLVKKLK
jgi:hypothetical protein